MNILVTGGAGFIGSALVRGLLQTSRSRVIVVDSLTYAGHLASLKDIEEHDRFKFYKADIGDSRAIAEILNDEKIGLIYNLAAESHVDRSINDAMPFLQTNVLGLGQLLKSSCEHWNGLDDAERSVFRFLHVSTDEVFGDLPLEGDESFCEKSAFNPSSPYSASKAASEHLVRAWGKTYGLPVLLTNCCNNFGPRQHPEKLIPAMMLNALNGRPLPVYGRGQNIRSWIHVDDNVSAMMRVMKAGKTGETYMIGGDQECSNLDMVKQICGFLDQLAPRGDGHSHDQSITFVADRPGHDLRYSVDCSKIKTDLGWRAQISLEDGLRDTISWYLENEDWWRPLVQPSAKL